MIGKLAWRNLWRNKRRTFITIAAIALAVLWSGVLTSVQRGTWNNMIDNMSKFYLGYAQIHSKGYWNEQSLDLAFDPSLIPGKLNGQLSPRITLVPRLESFALASYGLQTKGVLVMGIDPIIENDLTGMENKISKGNYLTSSSNGVVMGDKLADRLNIQLGDSLVLISQGYHGQNAAGKYPVLGMVHLRNPDLNKQLVAMPLSVAQNFYGTDNLITGFAINLDSQNDLKAAMKILTNKLDTSQYEIMDYNALIPEILEAAKLDTASAKLILYILYLLIGFGLFGTIIMMTKERSYEFGVMTAIGTEKKKLASILWIESLLIGLVGAIMGILISIPIVYYMHNHPIRLTGNMAQAYERFGMEPVISTAFNFAIFAEQALVMFFIASILSVYPIIKTYQLNSLKAMRG